MTYILYKDNIKLIYLYADKHTLTEANGINLYNVINGLEVLVATMFGELEKDNDRYKIHVVEF